MHHRSSDLLTILLRNFKYFSESQNVSVCPKTERCFEYIKSFLSCCFSPINGDKIGLSFFSDRLCFDQSVNLILKEDK